MHPRRFLVLVALGIALAGAYRRGFLRNIDDLAGWEAFVAVWLPAALVLGLAVVFLWPLAARLWSGVRATWRRRSGR